MATENQTETHYYVLDLNVAYNRARDFAYFGRIEDMELPAYTTKSGKDILVWTDLVTEKQLKKNFESAHYRIVGQTNDAAEIAAARKPWKGENPARMMSAVMPSDMKRVTSLATLEETGLRNYWNYLARRKVDCQGYLNRVFDGNTFEAWRRDAARHGVKARLRAPSSFICAAVR